MTYDFICTHCNDEFQHQQSMKEAFPTLCTKCGNTSIKRHYKSSCAFHFKGEGWASKEIRSNSMK